MNTHLATLCFVSIVAGALLSTAASAQDVPDHPRVNEIDQRLQNQQNRENAGAAKGQINSAHEERDQNRDARIGRAESRDEAKHNGHLTKGEQSRLNKKLNHNSQDIHHQRHG